ncbi:DUF3987 domain-containing protein [Desulfobotulus mexicanus]|uniref:DUF3987 domain-containing protein n=1 Tax=Desulfobotulus mexicanus TaxID=2586642 RepID=A0A5S5MF02_9BACT|nr:DUF3987 domain-containing protein [Desulfobotulus mexicanus]TYT74316.1 DUF3987 domain-containing protein [Desulfobotulus mexicanus]
MEAVEDVFPFRSLLYNSHSATRENPKARFLIPFEKPVSPEIWLMVQKILNKKIRSTGLIPDGANERLSQIFFLPNRGPGVYESMPFDGPLFDPETHWQAELAEERAILAEELAEERKRKKARDLKIRERISNGSGKTAQDAFNEEYPDSGQLWERYGATRQRGSDRLLSPHSESGAAAITINGNKWFSHHGSDAERGIGQQGKDGGCFGDSWDLYIFFEHGNDRSKALRHFGDNTINDETGNSLNKDQRLAYLKGNNRSGTPDQEQPKSTAKPFEVEPETFDYDSLITEGAEEEYDLPDQPKELLHLPGGLHLIKEYVYRTMQYPSEEMAAMTAFAILGSLAQKNMYIDSQQGLAFGEFHLFLAPSGVGKEGVAKAFRRLHGDGYAKVRDSGGDVNILRSKLLGGTGKTAQGIHRALEENNSCVLISDEFGMWLEQAGQSNSHEAGALKYLQEIYGRPFGPHHPGLTAGKDNQYEDVHDPRITLVCTSTPERTVKAFNIQDGANGAYNRLVIFIQNEQPEKVYRGRIYKPSNDLVEFISFVMQMKPQNGKIRFDETKAFDKYEEMDRAFMEPAKRRDPVLGGRLAEQAIRMAGLFALSEKRFEISPDDIEKAFKIRLGLHHRAAALLKAEGNMEGHHKTHLAHKHIISILKKKPNIYRSQLAASSKPLRALWPTMAPREHDEVIKRLCLEGICTTKQGGKGGMILFSCIYSS